LKRFLFAALFAIGTAHAADNLFSHAATLDQLATLLSPAQKPLQQSQALRGAFEQRKFLSGIPKALVSRGEFTFARERGVWWHTRTPFDSEFILTRDGMTQRDAGATPIKLSSQQQPALRVVADVFLSLFALDLRLLSENFDTFGMPDAQGWQLGLVPHAGALGGVVARVTIHGKTRVDHVDLVDSHGDRTELLLSDDGRGSGPLSPEEEQHFR
jgi:hypothetical protein